MADTGTGEPRPHRHVTVYRTFYKGRTLGTPAGWSSFPSQGEVQASLPLGIQDGQNAKRPNSPESETRATNTTLGGAISVCASHVQALGAVTMS